MQQLKDELAKVESIDECGALFVAKFHRYDQPPLKRWHFLDRISTAIKDLSDIQAQGVGVGISRVSKEIPRDDMFNVGEWSKARAIVFEVAEKLAASPIVQDFLNNVVRNSSSYVFSSDIIFFCKNKERNNIVTKWSHIDHAELSKTFVEVLKSDFKTHGPISILDQTSESALAILFGWYNCDPDGPSEVREYLKSEIEAAPSKLGRFIVWFFPHEHFVESNKDALLKLIDAATILQYLEQFGDNAWSSEQEKQGVQTLKDLLLPPPN